jgi:hypothetical protein
MKTNRGVTRNLKTFARYLQSLLGVDIFSAYLKGVGASTCHIAIMQAKHHSKKAVGQLA